MQFYNTIPLVDLSMYKVCLLFFIWSFLGWCIEVCVHTLKMGEYSDRGFLSMPMCPIYGFGVLIITVVLRPIASSAFLVFVLSSFICTLFELIVGVSMRKIFHNVWWDYRDEKFNFHGYICLKVSIEWGVGGLIVISFAEPFTEKLIGMLPVPAGTIVIAVMAVLIGIDTFASVAAVNKFNHGLEHFNEISAHMFDTAERIGQSLGDAALGTRDLSHEVYADMYLKADELSDRAKDKINGIADDLSSMTEEASRKLQARRDAYEAFSDRRVRRLFKAFPTMKPDRYNDAFEQIKSYISANKDTSDKKSA